VRRIRIALGAALAVGLLAAAPGSARAVERVPAVVHVHSDLSTGDFSLEEVAQIAEKQGIGAVLLVENYLLRFEYGLPPFRALTRVAREERSVVSLGLRRYLERVDQARRRFPRLVLIPGVEVIPHYFWTGSPANLALMLHNTQKNILVFGLPDEAAWAGLPATGNPGGRVYTWQSVADAVPALLLAPGLALLLRKRQERRRLARTVVVIRRRRWVTGGLLAGVGLAAVVRGWPFTVDRYPPWADFGLEPYQVLIDHVERQGGVAMWSFPEAPDEGEQHVGPVKVSWRTDPYVDDLLRTFRYTAFGAIYEQPTRVVQPGAGWDRLLHEYAAGERSRPAWAVGESGFHGLAGGKRLDPVQTVFLADARSEAAILDALRRGRFYALYRTPQMGLALTEFSLNDGFGLAAMGETRRVREGFPLEIAVAVEATDRTAHPVRVTLVKNGAAVGTWTGETPLRTVYRETFDGKPTVFRVDVRGRSPHQALSNPIFVTPPTP
jgi:hypothetical protein